MRRPSSASSKRQYDGHGSAASRRQQLYDLERHPLEASPLTQLFTCLARRRASWYAQRSAEPAVAPQAVGLAYLSSPSPVALRPLPSQSGSPSPANPELDGHRSYSRPRSATPSVVARSPGLSPQPRHRRDPKSTKREPVGGEVASHTSTSREDDADHMRGIRIPDTVVWENNIPKGWFLYDPKEGHIVRKKVETKSIQHSFLEHAVYADDVVAVLYVQPALGFDQEEAANETNTSRRRGSSAAAPKRSAPQQFQFITATGLEGLLFENGRGKGTAILQRFVPSLHGTHNDAIEAIWTPASTMVTRRQNIHELADDRIPINDRCVTFEGKTHLSRVVQSTSRLRAAVHEALSTVASHFHDVDPRHKLTRFVGRFKVNADSQLVLLHAVALRVMPTSVLAAQDSRAGVTIGSPSASPVDAGLRGTAGEMDGAANRSSTVFYRRYRVCLDLDQRYEERPPPQHDQETRSVLSRLQDRSELERAAEKDRILAVGPADVSGLSSIAGARQRPPSHAAAAGRQNVGLGDSETLGATMGETKRWGNISLSMSTANAFFPSANEEEREGGETAAGEAASAPEAFMPMRGGHPATASARNSVVSATAGVPTKKKNKPVVVVTDTVGAVIDGHDAARQGFKVRATMAEVRDAAKAARLAEENAGGGMSHATSSVLASAPDGGGRSVTDVKSAIKALVRSSDFEHIVDVTPKQQKRVCRVLDRCLRRAGAPAVRRELLQANEETLGDHERMELLHLLIKDEERGRGGTPLRIASIDDAAEKKRECAPLTSKNGTQQQQQQSLLSPKGLVPAPKDKGQRRSFSPTASAPVSVAAAPGAQRGDGHRRQRNSLDGEEAWVEVETAIHDLCYTLRSNAVGGSREEDIDRAACGSRRERRSSVSAALQAALGAEVTDFIHVRVSPVRLASPPTASSSLVEQLLQLLRASQGGGSGRVPPNANDATEQSGPAMLVLLTALVDGSSPLQVPHANEMALAILIVALLEAPGTSALRSRRGGGVRDTYLEERLELTLQVPVAAGDRQAALRASQRLTFACSGVLDRVRHLDLCIVRTPPKQSSVQRRRNTEVLRPDTVSTVTSETPGGGDATSGSRREEANRSPPPPASRRATVPAVQTIEPELRIAPVNNKKGRTSGSTTTNASRASTPNAPTAERPEQAVPSTASSAAQQDHLHLHQQTMTSVVQRNKSATPASSTASSSFVLEGSPAGGASRRASAAKGASISAHPSGDLLLPPHRHRGKTQRRRSTFGGAKLLELEESDGVDSTPSTGTEFSPASPLPRRLEAPPPPAGSSVAPKSRAPSRPPSSAPSSTPPSSSVPSEFELEDE